MMEIERPKIETASLSPDGRYGRFVAEPLERGFGITLGNSLRRVLLSSLPGVAVTSVKIDGVVHEFSTIEGVKEDVTEIVLNLKGIAAKLYTDGPKTVRVEAVGPCEVTADNIKQGDDIEILNPEWHIATLGIAVLVNLETESTDAAVIELGKDIAMQIAALNPTYMDKSDVSEEFIAKEKEIRLAQAKEDPKNAKKPDAIIEKIVMGGIAKYFKEICLLQQPFVKDDKVSVEDHIAAVAKQIGASIKLVGYT